MINIAIPEQFKQSILTLASTPHEKIANILNKIQNNPNKEQLTTKQLNQTISEEINSTPEKTINITKFLISIPRLSQALGKTFLETTEQLNDAINKQINLTPEQKDNWPQISVTIAEITQTPPFILNSIAKIAYSQGSTALNNFSITIDNKPIYEPTTTNIMGTITTNTLNITVFKNDQDEEIFIKTDKNDLKKIIKACETALKQIDHLEELLSQKNLIVFKQEHLQSETDNIHPPHEENPQ